MAIRLAYLFIEPIPTFYCIIIVLYTNVSEIWADMLPNAIDAMTTRTAIFAIHLFAVSNILCLSLRGKVGLCIVASGRSYQDGLESQQCSPASRRRAKYSVVVWHRLPAFCF